MTGMTDGKNWSLGFATGVLAAVWAVVLGIMLADLQGALGRLCRWLWKRWLALWRRIASRIGRGREGGQ